MRRLWRRWWSVRRARRGKRRQGRRQVQSRFGHICQAREQLFVGGIREFVEVVSEKVFVCGGWSVSRGRDGEGSLCQ